MSPIGLSSGVPWPEGHLPPLEAAPLGVPSDFTQIGFARRATKIGTEVLSNACLSCIDAELSIINKMSILSEVPWLVVGGAPPLAPVAENPPSPPPAPALVDAAPALVDAAPALVGGSLSWPVRLTLPEHAIVQPATPTSASALSFLPIFPDPEIQRIRPPPIAMGASIPCGRRIVRPTTDGD